MQRVLWVIDRLQLSQQQQHNIAQGMALVRRLLTPLQEELLALQLQQGGECSFAVATDSNQEAAAAAACASGACAGGSSSGGAAGDSANGLGEGAADYQQVVAHSLAFRRLLLEQQQQRSDRMRLLMAKVSRWCRVV
jgi:hypothetical protein